MFPYWEYIVRLLLNNLRLLRNKMRLLQNSLYLLGFYKILCWWGDSNCT